MRITLFTKQNCQLCDAIKYELLDLQVEYGFDFIETFLEEESGVMPEKMAHVPCVNVEREGQVILRLEHPIEQTALRRVIRAQVKTQKASPNRPIR